MAKKREQMLVIHKIQCVTKDIEMKQGETTEKEASSKTWLSEYKLLPAVSEYALPTKPPYLLILQSLPGMFEELELNPYAFTLNFPFAKMLGIQLRTASIVWLMNFLLTSIHMVSSV